MAKIIKNLSISVKSDVDNKVRFRFLQAHQLGYLRFHTLGLDRSKTPLTCPPDLFSIKRVLINQVKYQGVNPLGVIRV